MRTNFAALQDRVNAAVETHLSNAEADFGGLVGLVPGQFGNDYAEAFGIVAGSRPVFSCLSSRIPGVTQGCAVTVAGVAYSVAELRNNGAGVAMLILEEV